METLAEIHNIFGNIHFVKLYPTLNLHYDQNKCSLYKHCEIISRPVAIVDILTYRTIYGYERDHFWCRDILRLIIFL